MNKNLKLDSVDWKEFKLNDLFEKIERGKCKNTSEETKQSLNGVSFLSATLNNNGVSGFVEPNSLLQKGNCIMFVNQGDGGAGYSVYKKEDFISTTSNSFGYAKWINRYTGLFVASILCRFKEKYTFGYGRTENRLRKDKVFLPINSKGEPHWEFMENYMRQIEEKQIQKVISYYVSKVQNLQNNTNIIKNKNLNTIEWKEFKISSIFENYHGKRLIERKRERGRIPLLTAGESYNGVASFISNQKMEIFKDFISIDMFGNAFYHPYKATGDDNIYFFINDKLSTHIKLFIVSSINMQKVKYSYGKQFRQTNANNAKVMLPVDSKGEPHWEFMENFMREIEYKKLNLYLDYIKKTKANL